MGIKTRITSLLGSLNSTLLHVIAIILFSALCYLPMAGRLGFYKDDWYILYAATSRGASQLINVFSIDRPFNGYFHALMFTLFGTNAQLYTYSGFVVRMIGAFSFMWLIRMVWPKDKKLSGLLALLFVIYPGFLNQPNAIDYQPHLWSLSLAILSITLSIRSLQPSKASLKILLVTASILSQFLYLLLMEYYIGLEALRFFLIWYVIFQKESAGKWRKMSEVVIKWLPALLAALIFLVWRISIFENQRRVTDIGLMYSNFLGNSTLSGAWITVRLVKDTFSIVFASWAVPVYGLMENLRLKYLLIILALSLLSAIALKVIEKYSSFDDQVAEKISTGRDMLWIGFLTVLYSLIPIHFGNREVEFWQFSRFTLPGSIGVALILGGIFKTLTGKPLRIWLAMLLVGIAVTTHMANAIHFVENWDTIRNFWWQVSWRAPSIEAGSVLIANYADEAVPEDYVVWGPANLIYYPKSEGSGQLPLPLTAATLNQNDVAAIFSRADRMTQRRGMEGLSDYANTIILSKSSPVSCVHAINGNAPELSEKDRSEILLLAPFSQIDRIKNDKVYIPPETIFGIEPSRDWCFYYQKASLAAQIGNWNEVVRLGDNASAQGFKPSDPIEWFPFLEGYAFLGQEKETKRIASIIRGSQFLRRQSCQIIRNDHYHYARIYPDGYRLLVETMMCAQDIGGE